MQHFEDFYKKFRKDHFETNTYKRLLEYYAQHYYNMYYYDIYDIEYKGMIIKLEKFNGINIKDIIKNDLSKLYFDIYIAYEKHLKYDNEDFKFMLSGDSKIIKTYKYFFESEYVKYFFHRRVLDK